MNDTNKKALRIHVTRVIPNSCHFMLPLTIALKIILKLPHG